MGTSQYRGGGPTIPRQWSARHCGGAVVLANGGHVPTLSRPTSPPSSSTSCSPGPYDHLRPQRLPLGGSPPGVRSRRHQSRPLRRQTRRVRHLLRRRRRETRPAGRGPRHGDGSHSRFTARGGATLLRLVRPAPRRRAPRLHSVPRLLRPDHPLPGRVPPQGHGVRDPRLLPRTARRRPRAVARHPMGRGDAPAGTRRTHRAGARRRRRGRHRRACPVHAGRTPSACRCCAWQPRTWVGAIGGCTANCSSSASMSPPPPSGRSSRTPA
jgi:hypothetical protein